ncbi:hypothetical protein D3C85_112970 [compost metagenome]
MKQSIVKSMLCVLFFVVLATTLVSCKSTSVVPPTTTEKTITTTIKEVIHDTIFQTEKDSSYYKAYLECVNGKVVITKDKKPVAKPGKHLEPPKVNLQDNILTIDCKAEAQKMFAKWKDVYIKEHQQDIQKIPYPVPLELSWWQYTQIILGRLFIVIAFLIGLVFAFKNRI